MCAKFYQDSSTTERLVHVLQQTDWYPDTRTDRCFDSLGDKVHIIGWALSPEGRCKLSDNQMSVQLDDQPLSLLHWVSTWCAYPPQLKQHTVQSKCIRNWQEINAKLSDRRHRRSKRTGRYKDTTCQLVEYLSDTPTDVPTLGSTQRELVLRTR